MFALSGYELRMWLGPRGVDILRERESSRVFSTHGTGLMGQKPGELQFSREVVAEFWGSGEIAGWLRKANRKLS